MPLEDGGVAMPHNEEGLHKGSFPPQEELSSEVFCNVQKKTATFHSSNSANATRCKGRVS